MSDDGDKKYDPTPQRREQFRKDGRFAKARDAGGIAAAAAIAATLVASRATLAHSTRLLFTRTLGDLGALGRHDAGAFTTAIGALTALALPTAIAGAVAATTAGFAQAGLRLELDAISFKPERLNPLPKLQQLFSPKHGLTETVFAILRIVVVGYVGYRNLVVELPDLLTLSRMPLTTSSAHLMDAAVRVVLGTIGALGIVAAADYAQSRFSLEREMKMTLQEMKEESRSQDGDPKAKARMRQRARALAKKRAIQSVKTADVVVANPTHISVALRYSDKDAAPVVVAKGHDEVAMQIRAEARKHGIPILENRPLARALDREVRVGQAIPAAHFTAVAKVLAFVYRLRGKRGGTARA